MLSIPFKWYLAHKDIHMKKGQSMSPELIEKISKGMRGRTHSEETKEKIRVGMLGKKNNLGYVFTETHKLKMSLSQKQRHSKNKTAGSYRYKSRKLTELKTSIRNCCSYKQWRLNVFERDNFTCVLCGANNVVLNADHHPVSFATIFSTNKISSIEEAENCHNFWDIDNGRTLCVSCHKNTDTYGKFIRGK